MAKKKKKNKLSYFWGDVEPSGKKPKGKKGKKKDKKSKKYESPVLKAVSPTVSEKEMARAHKAAAKAPKIDKDIRDNQVKCNHVQAKMSVPDFKERFNEYVSPLLEEYVQTFGIDSVSVCAGCFTPLTDPRNLNPSKIRESYVTAIAAIDNVLPRVRMNKDEFRELKDAHDTLIQTMRTVLAATAKYLEAEKGRPVTVQPGGPAPVGAEAPTRYSSNGLEVPTGASIL